MKINSICTLYEKKYYTVNNTNPNINKNQNSVSHINTSNIKPYFNTFYCNRIISFGSDKLNTAYKNAGNSYLNLIRETNATAQELSEFLTAKINNCYSRTEFIKELTENPAESQEIVALLIKKLGGQKNFLQWYLGKKGYVYNYEIFLKEKFEKAANIDELLKFQPNWGYWALERKYCQMQGYNSKNTQDIIMRDQKANFTFGELPPELGLLSSFRNLINRLKSVEWMYNGNITTDSGIYKVKQLSGGNLSSKNIFEITKNFGSNTKKYIIKMDRFYPEDELAQYSYNPYISRLSKEAKLLRGDSVYLNACIDRYLALNGINTNAKLLFYDFKNNASVYEFVDATQLNENGSLGMIDQIEANKLFSDINKNGIYLNDIGLSFNCYRNKAGNLKLLDVGHAEYIDMLKPGGNLLTFETSNLSGFSLKNTLSALNLQILPNLDGKFEYSNNNISNHSYKSINSKNLYPNNFIKDYYEYISNLEKTFVEENFDFNDFCCNKNFYKQMIKSAISKAEEANQNQLAYMERLNLLDFYQKNILARLKGYMDNNIETIKDILDAMEREIEILSQNNINENIKALEKYKLFYSILKKGINYES